jgi:hypothetical protein
MQLRDDGEVACVWRDGEVACVWRDGEVACVWRDWEVACVWCMAYGVRRVVYGV